VFTRAFGDSAERRANLATYLRVEGLQKSPDVSARARVALDIGRFLADYLESSGGADEFMLSYRRDRRGNATVRQFALFGVCNALFAQASVVRELTDEDAALALRVGWGVTQRTATPAGASEYVSSAFTARDSPHPDALTEGLRHMFDLAEQMADLKGDRLAKHAARSARGGFEQLRRDACAPWPAASTDQAPSSDLP
jgi:hypothetical protein